MVVAKVPSGAASESRSGEPDAEVLPTVQRHLGLWSPVAGTLFSALLTDDGRVVVGAVAPNALYARSRQLMTEAAVATSGLTKRFGHQVAVDSLDLLVPDGGGLRLPRPQRLGEDHDDPDAARSGQRPRRAASSCSVSRCLRTAADVLRGSAHWSRGRRSTPTCRAGTTWPGSTPPTARRTPRTARSADRRRAGPGRAARRSRQALPRVLPRHAPAAGHRQRAAAAPRPARARRAHQRPRPAGHPRGPVAGRVAGGRGHDRAGLEPPALRGRADVHPRRRDARRAAGRPGHQRRGAGRHRGRGDRRDRPAAGGRRGSCASSA